MGSTTSAREDRPPVLLVVDDEPSILRAFGWVFRKPRVNLLTAGSAADAIDIVARLKPDVVVLDVNLPDQSGLEAYGRIRTLDARIPVIFITGHGTTDSAIEATKLGALNYLFKPLDLDKLREVVTGAFEVSRRMRVPALVSGEQTPDDSSDVLIGRCESMNEVYQLIGRAAPQDIPVLILGESGTGKELVARAIWNHSRRTTAPFLAVNCAAIAETLLESELFGHEKGAFTGADRLRIGRFEQCNGGTLFLDEIGDLSPSAQAKILRVLQEQEFERVGGNQVIRTDVRLITATNRKLEQLLPTSEFRSDLYYRLSVFSIRLPPLRERGDDLELMVKHFLRRFARELGKDVQSISPEAVEILRRYPWPGNIRQLQSVLKQALLRAAGPVLIADFLPQDVLGLRPAEPDAHAQPGALAIAGWDQFISGRIQSGSENVYAESMAVVERHLLNRVLASTHGNQMRAAKMLGITRGTLRNKIRSLGIEIDG